MGGSQTFPKLGEQSVDDHAVIHFHLDQLERALRDLDPTRADAEAMRNVAVRIDSFRERLDEHFAIEEDGGLLQGVLDALPQADSDVRRIKAEHARLREALETARRTARAGDPATAAGLKADLERIAAALREHEREEDALVKRALRRA